MEEWKEYKLGEILCEKGYIRGPFGSALKRGDMLNEGIPVYEQQHAIYGKRDFRYYISKDKYDEMKRFTVYPGDIIISCSGTIGEVSIIKEEDPKGIISQALLLLRSKKEVVMPEFLLYFFRTPQGHNSITSRSSGSVQVNIARRDVIEQIPLYLPHRKMQNRIVSILKSLDDKIEVNRRINDNLEQQAQALFKSWFVDFEPFRDQPFVESELGAIPQSLIMEYISNIPHTLETGRRPKGGVGELTSGVPSVGAEHVKGMGNYDYSKTKFIPADYASSLKTGKVNGYELLIYKDGGKPGYFIPNYSIFGEGYPYDECYLNEHVFKLDFGNKGYNAFCYFFFKTDFVMNYLNAQGGKAAIPGINRQDIENILVYSPQNESVKDFGKLVLPMIKQILINCKESHRLAQLRDTLLPRLMSGKLKLNA